MNIEYIEIIDYILAELNEREENYGEDLDSILHKYEKETGKDSDKYFWEKLIRICEDKYLVSSEHNSFIYRITPTGLEILIQYGSYLEYWKSQNEEYVENKEIKELEKNNLKLQNESLEYKQTIREQKQTIIELDIKLKKWGIFKFRWWLITGLLSILLAILSHLLKLKELFLQLMQ